MSFTVHPYTTQKMGAESGDCEDAICFNGQRGVFAVADGATEAFDSRYWARLLTRGWVRSTADTLDLFLNLVAALAGRVERRWAGRNLAWYAEEKARGGSFAAFLGLTISPNEDGVLWSAISIGDCCLFQLRDSELVASVPISSAEEFGNRPTLLSSKAAAALHADGLKRFSGTAIAGDRFLLLSDSVASWFLRNHQSNRATCDLFERLLRQDRIDELDILFDEVRADATMKNDDVAALHVAMV